MSFAKLAQRLKNGFAASEPERRNDPLPLATAAVLLEVGNADGKFSPAEDGDLVGYLQNAFSLSAEDVRELIEEAEEIRRKTIDHFALTNFIRKNMSLADRIEIVKAMWRIVYADGKLDEYENYLVRKLADLLGLEHRVMIDAKVAVIGERDGQ